MSKMQKPKAEVIRFKEGDIIVASGHGRSAILSGWGDNVNNNAKITFTGEKETSYTWETLHNQALEDMLSNLTFIHDNNFTTLNDLALNEDMAEEWNGRYRKGDDGKWYWQGRQ